MSTPRPVAENFIFCGGPIRTLRDEQPLVDAVGVSGGLIVAAGSRPEVEACFPSSGPQSPRAIDLQGAALYPGFVDSHTHLGGFGLRLSLVDLDGVSTMERACRLVADHARTVERGRWIRGGGWDKNLWGDGRFPTRHDLDRVVPDRPVALSSKDGHAWWVNTEALRLAGVTRDTPDPPGGEIERDARGEPTGIFKENAGSYVSAVVEQPTAKDYETCIARAVAAAHRHGLVGAHDMEGRESFKAYQSLDEAGTLAFRVWLYVPADLLGRLTALGLGAGFGSPFLKIAGVKAFLDGALGSQTADMLAPYEGSGGQGIETMSAEGFSQLVEGASSERLAVAVHAIGDRANRKALDVFGAHEGISRAAGLRHRIEHMQLLDPADIPRVGRMGIVASMQPIHAPSDRDMAARYWGAARSSSAYAWRSVADSGAVLAFGSDTPVETMDPLQGLFAAVTRRHPKEPTRGPWHPEQAVSPLEAVRAYTSGAAWAVSAERERGTIEAGKVADFTVLSEDILSIGAYPVGAEGAGRETRWSALSDAAERTGELLLRSRVVATVVGGTIVHGCL
ncbi:MAG: amidohydrolase [Bacillota bacterium]|nr:MAG: amidohydrolase [Bacillota bacterium]